MFTDPMNSCKPGAARPHFPQCFHPRKPPSMSQPEFCKRNRKQTQYAIALARFGPIDFRAHYAMRGIQSSQDGNGTQLVLEVLVIFAGSHNLQGMRDASYKQSFVDSFGGIPRFIPRTLHHSLLITGKVTGILTLYT